MNVFEKFVSAMKGDDDYEDDFYDDDFVDDEYEAKPSKRAAESESKKVTPMRNSRSRGSSAGMEVVVIKPVTMEDAREITDTLLANKIVNLNLEGIDVAIAQRIIDYTSGSTYAMGGNLQKISHHIFLITPRTVDISGDFQESGDVAAFSTTSVN